MTKLTIKTGTEDDFFRRGVCWQGLRIAVNSYPMSALSALKTPLT